MRNRCIHIALLVALLSATLSVGAGRAQAFTMGFRGPSIELLRFEGYLRPSDTEDRKLGDVEFYYRGKSYHLDVTDLQVLVGHRLDLDILLDAARYRPSFFLRGPHEVMERLDTIGPDDKVEILALHYRSRRNLRVREITVQPAEDESSHVNDS